MMATGIGLMALIYNPLLAIQNIVGSGMIFTALFAAITAVKCKNLQIPLKYHSIHALSMLVFGLAVLIFASDFKLFFTMTSSFLMFYGIAEVIFSFQIVMLEQKNVHQTIVIVRFIIGCFIALGAVLILVTSFFNQNNAITVAGIIFIFSGLNLILFRTVLKNLKSPI